MCELQSINSDSLAKIDGICYRDIDGHIVTNKASKIVAKKDLETILPGVAWDLLPSFDNTELPDGIPGLTTPCQNPIRCTLHESWCPYRCSFCMINIINRTNAEDGVTSEDVAIFF